MFRSFPSIKVVLAATVLFQMPLSVSNSWANVFAGSGPGNATLLFAGSGDRVNNSGTLILSAGNTAGPEGYLNTGGLSDGTVRPGPGGLGAVVGMGALTLRANATIDLTGADGRSESVFQTSNFISGTVANIIQWTGTAGADGSDRLLFATNPSLTTKDRPPVQFANYADTNFAIGEMMTDDSGYYELAQAPEPATWAAAAMTLLAVAVTQRRRLAVLRRSWR